MPTDYAVIVEVGVGVLLQLAVVAVWGGSLTQQVKSHEKRLDHVETTITNHGEDIASLEALRRRV